ncbi:hypothetical protein F8M41_015779 [Gigaspora margarita]|uniref:Uncharacterized protein n=1 Tax=Gigaspora margarita TaxID=4874 RepID=A0A8H4EN99_GIGMA|nr:hypothetical protein F8M41_015779 [Gigaspora margarita]
MNKETQKIADQINYMRNIAKSKDSVNIEKLKKEINKRSINELFEKANKVNLEEITENIYDRILEEWYDLMQKDLYLKKFHKLDSK